MSSNSRGRRHDFQPRENGRTNCAIILLMNQNEQARPAAKGERESELLGEQMRRMANGDETALGELYDLTVNRVYALALRVTQRPEIAEEVVSDVYVQAWRSASRYDGTRGTVRGWLTMLCRSRAIDALRREGPDRAEEGRNVEDIPGGAEFLQQDLIMALERSTAVHRAVAGLDETQRQLISLAFYRGLTHTELASYTGMPLGTVKTTLRRAYAALRGVIGASEYAQEGTHES
ncbi:MAG: sigma-70 family RNA polymerase sigma factor [Pseudomonadota bacterium]|nr:sigma-70 family RNA polymerase sigma factor [Pseudomonadota bacterium]